MRTAGHHQGLGAGIDFHRYVAALALALQQEGRTAYRPREIYRPDSFILAREAFQLADDGAHACAGIADVAKVAGRLFRLAAFQEGAGVVGKGADRGQRLVQFMRHAGRHLAQHGQFAGLHHLVLRGAQDAVGFAQLLRALGDARF
jgi:hypothetical protein